VHYAGGDLKLDNNEIGDAKWFEITEILKSKEILLPNKCSISRHIIDSYINRSKNKFSNSPIFNHFLCI